MDAGTSENFRPFSNRGPLMLKHLKDHQDKGKKKRKYILDKYFHPYAWIFGSYPGLNISIRIYLCLLNWLTHHTWSFLLISKHVFPAPHKHLNYRLASISGSKNNYSRFVYIHYLCSYLCRRACFLAGALKYGKYKMSK